MGSVTIRNIDDEVKRGARIVAAAKGRSLEAELRDLLNRTYAKAGDDHTARIRAMSGREFINHLVAITRPGFDDDPFAIESQIDEDRDIFGAN